MYKMISCQFYILSTYCPVNLDLAFWSPCGILFWSYFSLIWKTQMLTLIVQFICKKMVDHDIMMLAYKAQTDLL